MNDPRKEPGFIPSQFPRCDGQPFAAVSNSDGLHHVKAQFLAAYYRINVAYARRRHAHARLSPAGRAGPSAPLLPPRRSRSSLSPRERAGVRGNSAPFPVRRSDPERSVLQAIERALRAKEALEDRYAPRGIVATPVYRRGYAVDVRFQHPRALPIRPMAVVSSSSRTLVFALPRGLKVKRRK